MSALLEQPRIFTDRIVFLFAAGFSCAAGTPAMKNFVSAATRIAGAHGETRLKRELTKLSAGHPSFQSGDLQTVLRSLQANGSSSNELTTLTEAIVKGVSLPLRAGTLGEAVVSYDHFFPTRHWVHPRANACVTPHEALLSQILAANARREIEDQHLVISLNYDPLLPLVVNQLGGTTTQRCPLLLEGPSGAPRERALHVINLHGSVLWQPSDHAFCVLEPRAFFDALLAGSYDFDQPRLVLPSARDPIGQDPLLRQVVECAEEQVRAAVSLADRVVIVGYSFSQADTYCTDLLKSRLAQHAVVEVWDIATGKEGEALKQRAIQAFPNSQVKYYPAGLRGLAESTARPRAV